MNAHVSQPFRMILNRFQESVPEPEAFRDAMQMRLPGDAGCVNRELGRSVISMPVPMPGGPYDLMRND